MKRAALAFLLAISTGCSLSYRTGSAIKYRKAQDDTYLRECVQVQPPAPGWCRDVELAANRLRKAIVAITDPENGALFYPGSNREQVIELDAALAQMKAAMAKRDRAHN